MQIGIAAGLMRTFGYTGSIASSAIMTTVSVIGLLLVLLDRGPRTQRANVVRD